MACVLKNFKSLFSKRDKTERFRTMYYIPLILSEFLKLLAGTTRDSYADKQVVRLEFEAYDGMVYKELDRLCDEVRQTYPNIDRIALFHKVG